MKRLNGGELLIDLTGLGEIGEDPISLPQDVWESIKKNTKYGSDELFHDIVKPIIFKFIDNSPDALHFTSQCVISDDKSELYASTIYRNIVTTLTISTNGSVSCNIIEIPLE